MQFSNSGEMTFIGWVQGEAKQPSTWNASTEQEAGGNVNNSFQLCDFRETDSTFLCLGKKHLQAISTAKCYLDQSLVLCGWMLPEHEPQFLENKSEGRAED